MNAQDRAAMKALLAKLSAVRMTLADEEQALLDGLVLSRPAEVAAHRMAQAADLKADPAVADVAAHRMAQAADLKADPAVDEVAAHRMAQAADLKADPAVADVAAHRMAQAFEIIFDTEMEAYQIKP